MTARSFTVAFDTAIQQSTLRPVLFYQGEFASSQYLRLWSGFGDVSWDGYTWTGGGNLLNISPLEERGDVKAQGFTITLSGMPSALVSLALASVRQGKPGKLWMGLFDSSDALIADPYQLRAGKLDISVIEDDGDSCTIAMQYEDRLIDLDRARERRYTTEDQAIDYAGDLGFEFVPKLQDMQIMWGGPGSAASPVANSAGSVAGGGTYTPGDTTTYPVIGATRPLIDSGTSAEIAAAGVPVPVSMVSKEFQNGLPVYVVSGNGDGGGASIVTNPETSRTKLISADGERSSVLRGGIVDITDPVTGETIAVFANNDDPEHFTLGPRGWKGTSGNDG